MKGNVDHKKLELLRGMYSQLCYHKSIGITGYPKTREVLSFLQSKPLLPQLSQQKKSTGIDNALPKRVPTGVSEVESGVTLVEIADEVESCQACGLHNQRIYPVPGKGPEKVRLMIIGDWLAADDRGELPAGLVFGVKQDRMLGKMLEAINLAQQDVFITNVIKCALSDNCQPQAAHVESCVSYLRRQIVTLMPEVICTMGMVAARALLEKSQPLSRLRSQFHNYSPQKSINIPVLATYHPTYLLQNTEMKRATWMDLQLLAKKLGIQV